MRRELLTDRPWPAGLLIVCLYTTCYLPSLGIYLQGDDFAWLDHSYPAVHSPSRLLEPISVFFRPLVKVTYLVDYTLFGTNPVAYNLTNIALCLAGILLLYCWLYREYGRVVPAALTSLLFATSALHSEVPLWCAARMDSLTLIFFLGALLLVPSPANGTTGKAGCRPLLVLLLGVLATGAKESWVLLPFLLLGFLLIVRRLPLVRAMVWVAGLLPLLLLYLGYFLLLPRLAGGAPPTTYAESDLPHMVIKAGYMLLRYVGLAEHYSGTPWQLALIAVVLGGLCWRLLASGNRLAQFGLLWMLMTIAISLPVYHISSRYHYLPLVGFWVMVVAATSAELPALVQRSTRRMAIVCISLLICCYLPYQIIMIQWDIRDYRFRGYLHQELAEMFLQIDGRLPRDLPIVFLDLGKRRAVDEATRAIRGYRKLFFARNDAIWQQVYLAPLANFLGDPFTCLLRPVPPDEVEEILQGPVTTLVFTDAGFTLPTGDHHLRSLRALSRRQNSLPPKVQVLRFYLGSEAPAAQR